ncbi:MAG TPA: methyltransferase domain-containing protein [Solirubrobacteraceae bacterium]|nr:methyltransferase domain-containing protein [Solirubrobacteraceae bacterium]
MRRGGAFYDLPGVLERYREARPPGVSDPNRVMEEPALLEALGSVEGLRVVDLGCGDAALGRRLLSAGCARYLAIDGSARMVEAARETLRGTAGEVERRDIEDFSAPPGAFDLVVSRMALHYVEDVSRVLSACHACLAPGGRVVFTVVHPVITSHDARASTEELRADWVVDDYFAAGPRELDWLGGAVVWHHRTIEAYVAALQGAGLALTAVRECPPRRERFEGDETELARRNRIPLFLLLAGARG